MQLVTTPVALPGCCFICRGAQRESYVDTGVSLDHEGAFYICNLCINEVAHIYSYISHDEYKDMRASKEDLEHINYELIKRVGALEESLRALADAGYKYNSDYGVVAVGGYNSKTLDEAARELPGRKTSLENGERESSEQNDDEDLAGVCSSGDSESDFVLDI